MVWRPVPTEGVRGQVYVLHFDRPVGTERQQARHYIGWALRAEPRIQAHRRGWGARLLEVLHEAGGSFTVAQVWPDATRADERRLKNRGGGSRVCAVCLGHEYAPRRRRRRAS